MLSNLCRLLLATLLCASAVATAAAPEKEKPLKIPTDRDLGFFTDTRAATLGLVKRVGLLPPRPPPGFEARDDVKQLLEKTVTEHLRAAGFDVVGSAKYAESFDRLNKQVGGIYDPDTGVAKPEQYRAVVDYAHREFIEGEKLDGYVIVRILNSRVKFYSDSASWDGVTERSTGRLPANAFTAFWSASDSSGTLPGFSVAVQISNTQDKIVFGRLGGLQLAAYYDIPKSKGVTNFLLVPFESLFQDAARIERAVRVATQPLRYSGEEIARGEKDPAVNPGLIKPADLPPAPEGVERKTESPLRVARDEILGSVRRVAVSSLDVASFTPPDDVRARYVDLVRAELAPLGWEIVPAPTAHELLVGEVKKAGGLYDPYTGEMIEARASAMRKSVFTALGTNPPPDAILWISLKRALAQQSWGDAVWDGVSQSAITLGPVTKRFWSGSGAVQAGEGNIQAVSLYVQLRNANDVQLYESRGGIQLTQQMRGKETSTLAPNELFKDTTREQPAVHAALRNLVLTPEQLDAELNPKKPAKK
jgi:hypothetical protein